MKDFNIAEALKFAPKGLKLYTPIFGQVQMYKIKHKGYIELEYGKSDGTFFSSQGKYYHKGECLLFPSKDHRTWDNWQDILFPQSIGSVCAFTGTIPQPTMFLCTSNGTVFSDNTGNTWDVLIGHSGNYLKSSRYATPEESKQFFDGLKANGYEWDAEKKELKKLQSNKFDISTLKPFDKVLVRDYEDNIWTPDFYSFYSTKTNLLCRFNTITDAWKCCIPYNDDTKHLVGTTNDVPEFYKTWEYDK